VLKAEEIKKLPESVGLAVKMGLRPNAGTLGTPIHPVRAVLFRDANLVLAGVGPLEEVHSSAWDLRNVGRYVVAIHLSGSLPIERSH
jgi:hypothetical protein